jgi:SAM-dependent methyltransferase
MQRYEKNLDLEKLTELSKNNFSKDLKFVIKQLKDNQCSDLVNQIKLIINENRKNKKFIEQADKIINALVASSLLYKNFDLDNKLNFSPANIARVELGIFYKHFSSEFIKIMMRVETPVRDAWNHFWHQNPDYNNHVKILDFYRTTESYIFELMAANNMIETLNSYCVFLEEIKNKNITQVIDYGAGVGSLVILLKEKKYDVIYADLKSKTSDFARWRFKERQMDIPFLELDDNIKQLTESDLIICTEVLEHIPNPEELILSFKSKYLAISESFDYIDEFCTHLPQHKGKSSKFIQMMYKLDFKLISDKAYPIYLFEKQR